MHRRRLRRADVMSGDMELIQFILTYFTSKKLTLLSAFLCWRPEVLSELHRAGGAAGVRLAVHSARHLPRLPAYDVHREGFVLDVACPGADLLLDKASMNRAFIHRYSWLLLHDAAYNQSRLDGVLASTAILPDADVVWVAADRAVDLYRVKPDQPLLITDLDMDKGASRQELEVLWGRWPTTVTRRKDLRNLYLKAATVITQPQHFKGWTDFTNRHIDTFPKLTYPLMMICAEDLNFRYNMRQVDLYGECRNGSFDGLVGLLQRRGLELGVTSLFMRQDRSRVLHYASETLELRGAFIFRQPAQSAVSNMFLLPFSRGVWAASGGAALAAAAALAGLARAERRRRTPPDAVLARTSLPEVFTFIIGTVCQQGYHATPQLLSARVAILVALLAALFGFTSYSAKIVAILQTPSDSIRSIADLAASDMRLGVQETTYKKVYFAESRDPATQRLYRQKLLPLGERAYLSVVDGVARMRTDFFAFQVEQSSGYDIISKTFTEREKCGLKEIEAFKLPMVCVPLRRHSGYRELFAARLRWQRETGLMDRTRRLWLAQRVRCAGAAGGFVSVRLRDVLPALRALAAGAALAALLLAAERAAHTITRTAQEKVTCGSILPEQKIE